MALLPIIAFPNNGESGRKMKDPSPPGRLHLPPLERQTQRLNAQFSALERGFESGRITVSSSVDGLMLEQVLVMETMGAVSEFYKAVRTIEGLEWLDEWESVFEPDNDFYLEDDREKNVTGRLYLAASNQESLRKIKGLWELYSSGETKFPYGQAKWKELFSHLRVIRNWSIEDRLSTTGVLEDWQDRLSAGSESVRFEIELWFRGHQETRNKRTAELQELLSQVGATVICESTIPEILYHALLVEAPIEVIHDILAQREVQFVRSESVMFVRPTGQAVVSSPEDQPLVWDQQPRSVPDVISVEPAICLLDGLPIENHDLISNKVIVDDPENWSTEYPAAERNHGTAMASLIINGDTSENSSTPLTRPIYVRPVMKPNPRDWRDIREEGIPEDRLTIDLVHLAIRRLFDENQDTLPVAPSVKIINISLGDQSRVFEHAMSPWARLLDWLSWKYRVLFIVSAGNYSKELELKTTARREFPQLDRTEVQRKYIDELLETIPDRRLLSPAEFINGLTVGAIHYDSSVVTYLANRVDLVVQPDLPSPITRAGLGYRRSIKPDVVMPGGRQLYREKLGNGHTNAVLELARVTSTAPGHLVASPGNQGELNARRYTTGTSNAAALTTHLAGQLYEYLMELRQDKSFERVLRNDLLGVVLKAMIVHGARWGNVASVMREMLRPQGLSGINRFKNQMSALIGYGQVDASRLFGCTDQRATLIGTGEIEAEQAHIYRLPLPISLSGKQVWRRLTITLTWFSPIHSGHQGYRKASLWFDPPTETLSVSRTDAHWQAVQRGTVQHEILEGDNVTAFTVDDYIQIQVNCRSDAGVLNESVPYCLVASLEVAEGVDIPIYQEIRERVRTEVRQQTRINTD